MTDQHPVTPPPELVQQWYDDARDASVSTFQIEMLVAARAAQWGADQELEACCHCFARDLRESLALELRAARRPKPPSLKEQALGMLENAWKDGHISNKAAQTICRALEALPE
jgi:hypothetical protein